MLIYQLIFSMVFGIFFYEGILKAIRYLIKKCNYMSEQQEAHNLIKNHTRKPKKN